MILRRHFLQQVAGTGAVAAWGPLPGCATAPTPSARSGAPSFKMAAFSFDVTPPIGYPQYGGMIVTPYTKYVIIEEPLSAKGLVIEGQGTRSIVCVLDWHSVRNATYDTFRRRMAAAAGIEESQVAIHTTHTHSAPLADVGVQQLLDREVSPPSHLDFSFMEDLSDRAAAAVGEAAERMRPFTQVGLGRAEVASFASSRRLLQENGTIVVRMSKNTKKDPYLAAAPEGRVDRFVRTVTLLDGDQPLARLHYYATHPMSHYGQGEVSPDVPGFVRKRLEQEEGIPHLYFNGCGGDVAAGKYNDGSEEARAHLIDSLYTGIKGAIAATQVKPMDALSWQATEIRLPPRTEPSFAEARFRKDIADPGLPPEKRIHSAEKLAWLERVKRRPGLDVSCMRLGPATILHLPGETFVEYQLFAQSLRPHDFIAVAAYGDCGCGYICTDKAIAQGGYEPTVAFVGPPSEALLKRKLAQLVRGNR